MIDIKICIAAYTEHDAWAIFASHREVIDDIEASSPHPEDFMCSSDKAILQPPSDGVWMFVGTRRWASWCDEATGGDPNGDEPVYAGTYRRLTDGELSALGSGENPCDYCGAE